MALTRNYPRIDTPVVSAKKYYLWAIFWVVIGISLFMAIGFVTNYNSLAILPAIAVTSFCGMKASGQIEAKDKASRKIYGMGINSQIATNLYNSLSVEAKEMARPIVLEIYKIEDEMGMSGKADKILKPKVEIIEALVRAEEMQKQKALESSDSTIHAKMWLENFAPEALVKPETKEIVNEISPKRGQCCLGEPGAHPNCDRKGGKNSRSAAQRRAEQIREATARRTEYYRQQKDQADIQRLVLERQKSEIQELEAKISKLEKEVKQRAPKRTETAFLPIENQYRTTEIIETGDGRQFAYSYTQQAWLEKEGSMGSCKVCRRLMAPGKSLCKPCKGRL